MRHPPPQTSALVLPVVLLLAGATGASAQQRPYSAEEARWLEATWVDDLGFAAGNALISGLGTGVIRWLQGGDFSDAFVRGTLGGAVGYAGKRLAAERFDGAGLLGRTVHAVGTSMSRNARRGETTLDEVFLPLGPVWVGWRPGDGVSAKLDLLALYWLGYGLVEDRLELDWGRSLSAGAPVFVTGAARFEDRQNGQSAEGVVFLSRYAEVPLDDVASHERVHVLQRDMATLLYGEALDAWLAGLAGGRLADLQERVFLGLSRTALSPLWRQTRSLPRGARVNEVEADYLEIRSR